MNKVYRSKRFRIVNRVRFTTFVCAMILITIFATSALFGYSDAEAISADKYITIQVQSGDTLWNLAKAYGPSNADIRNIVCEIEHINGITASTLKAGQYIDIPTK